MALIKGKLSSLLKEENGELQYKTDIEGETFQIDVELDKAGISLTFTPVNPEGTMIINMSEEEINTLKNSLMTSLGPKFSRYKLELSAEDIKGDEKQIKISIPAGSVFPFIQNVITR